MQKLIPFLILAVGTISQDKQQGSTAAYDADSETIRVPERRGIPVTIDGMFSKGEWDQAAHFLISEKCEIYFLADSESLYVGLKFVGEFVGEAVSELYIAKSDTEFFNLHSSGASGEGTNRFADDFRSTIFSVGNNKVWESNPGKKGDVQCYGKEYRISRKKLAGTSLKFAGGIMFVNRSMRVAAHFPKAYNFKNSDSWVELILPSSE